MPPLEFIAYRNDTAVRDGQYARRFRYDGEPQPYREPPYCPKDDTEQSAAKTFDIPFRLKGDGIEYKRGKKWKRLPLKTPYMQLDFQEGGRSPVRGKHNLARAKGLSPNYFVKVICLRCGKAPKFLMGLHLYEFKKTHRCWKCQQSKTKFGAW